MIGFGGNNNVLECQKRRACPTRNKVPTTLFGKKETRITFAAIKQLVGTVSKRTFMMEEKKLVYNVTTLPIWAELLHFVSTDHLGTVINFGQKEDSSGTGSETFCKFSFAGASLIDR